MYTHPDESMLNPFTQTSNLQTTLKAFEQNYELSLEIIRLLLKILLNIVAKRETDHRDLYIHLSQCF